MAARFISTPSVTAFCNISNCRMTLTSRTADSALPVLDASSLPCSTVAPTAGAGRSAGSVDAKVVVAVFHDAVGAGEIGEFEFADDRAVLADRAVGRDIDGSAALQRHGRAGGAADRIAFGGDQFAVAGQAEIAVARIERTAGPLTEKKPRPESATSSGLPVACSGPCD